MPSRKAVGLLYDFLEPSPAGKSSYFHQRQGYGLEPDDFRMVVSTFRTAFPDTSMWNPMAADHLLLGSPGPTALDLTPFPRRHEANAALRRDLEKIGVAAWPRVPGFLILAPPDVARLAGGVTTNTGDRLPLEFSAPRALYQRTESRNASLLLA